MVTDVIFRQAVELGGVPHLHLVDVLLDMLGKSERYLRCLVGQLAQVGARSFILIYASQAVVQERLAYVVRGRRVSSGHIDGREGAVDLLIERKGGGRFGYRLRQFPGFVAHCFVRVHTIQQ